MTLLVTMLQHLIVEFLTACPVVEQAVLKIPDHCLDSIV